MIPDFLERQSFPIPFRAFEWAEAPELERTILAYFSPTLDFAIASQPQSNHPLWNFPLLNQWAGEAMKQAFASTHIRCFFSTRVRRSPPRGPIENGTPGVPHVETLRKSNHWCVYSLRSL